MFVKIIISLFFALIYIKEDIINGGALCKYILEVNFLDLEPIYEVSTLPDNLR